MGWEGRAELEAVFGTVPAALIGGPRLSEGAFLIEDLL